MKIRVAILDEDTAYLNRIMSTFNVKYSDKLEMYAFSNDTAALLSLSANKIDVFLASEDFNIEPEFIPPKCCFAYLVEMHDVESVRERVAVCKFQKAELIYKQILSLYSEKTTLDRWGKKVIDDGCKIIGFTSPCGGVGTSTMAAAFCLDCTKKGKKAVYVNLETFGSSDVFFEADGSFDMSDVIYSIKSKKTNVSLKIESCMKEDVSGVCFFSETKTALDKTEFRQEEINRLLSELVLMGKFDYIVVDMNFSIEKGMLDIYKQLHDIVLVGDGRELSNKKIQQAYEAICILEENYDTHLSGRISIVYNQFSTHTSSLIDNAELKNIGGAPRIEHATAKQIVQEVVKRNIFESLY